MAESSLQERLTQLEAVVAELRNAFQSQGMLGQNRWLKEIEKFVGDEDLQAVFAEGKKLREADRARARRPAKRRKGNS